MENEIGKKMDNQVEAVIFALVYRGACRNQVLLSWEY